jgi:hypothetical protein
MRPKPVGCLLFALAACEHSPPFGTPATGSGPPPGTGTPAQLTYNPGQSRTPSWLPDGSGILYSMERLDRADHDRCLGELPPGGGQVTRLICHLTPGGVDSVDVFESPAAATDGRLAFVYASSPLVPPHGAPTVQALVLTTLARSDSLRVLQDIPYTSPSGITHEGVSYLAWLGDSSLVYVGEHVDYADACGSLGCVFDTLHTGVEVMRLTPGAATSALSVIFGTSDASSVAPVGTDTIYFTRNGDSRVYRRVLSSGAQDIVYDFAGPPARDVAVVGATLVAVVGGMDYYTIDSTLGPRVRDYGGELHVVDMVRDTDVVMGFSDLDHPIWFRRPALSPDGRLLVAEGRHYTLVRHTDEAGTLLWTDTIIDPAAKLFEYTLP